MLLITPRINGAFLCLRFLFYLPHGILPSIDRVSKRSLSWLIECSVG